MAKIKVISSGSVGNSYILSTEKEILLLEIGINWNDIIKELKYDKGLSKVVGCIVSHKHLDHIKANTLKKTLKHGIKVYSCQEVHDVYDDVRSLEKNKKYKIGGFIVQPIPLYHNAECYGYIIQHEEFGKLVFATDTNSFPYKISGINHFLLEANYSEEIIIDRACDNIESRSASENHMEINETIETLTANYSCDMQTIMLIHLSGGNSDERKFKQMVKDKLGFENVYVAEKGLVVELNKEDF